MKCLHDISLHTKTWIHRGGNVNSYYIPENIDELAQIGKALYANGTDFMTIGHTSNIYFKDSFCIDAIIDTKQLRSYHQTDEQTLRCECGVHINLLSKYCIKKGFAGYEGLVNLPGTIGGAIVNNAGCYKCGIENILKSIDLLTPEGKIINIPKEQLKYTFRNSSLKNGQLKGIILYAYLDISNKDDAENLEKIAVANTHDRKITQEPPTNNLGSTVNCFYRKRNLKNTVIKITSILVSSVIKDPCRNFKLIKKLTLTLYGKKHLYGYISNKKIECFLWKDANADKYFNDYISLIDAIYSSYSIEIEIKE